MNADTTSKKRAGTFTISSSPSQEKSLGLPNLCRERLKIIPDYCPGLLYWLSLEMEEATFPVKEDSALPEGRH